MKIDWTKIKHFQPREFACHCGCGFCDPASRLVEGLEHVRQELNSPIILNSGCRCQQHNRSVGGSQSSQHIFGNGADISAPGCPLKVLYAIVDRTPEFIEGTIIIHPKENFLHIDVRGYCQRFGSAGAAELSIDEALAMCEKI